MKSKARLTKQGLNLYLFWIGYWLIWVLILSSFQDFTEAIWVASVNVALQGCVAFANIRFLLPHFFEKRYYIAYILIALLVLVVLTRIHLYLIDPATRFLYWNREIRFPKVFQFGRIYFFMIIVLAISTAFKFATDRLQALQRQAEMSKQQLEIELETLKNQINPHFLFNTLNNIYTLTYLKDDNAAPMILKLSELLRYMLYDCQENQVKLEEEVRFLQNLVAMQKLKSEACEQHIHLEIAGVKSHHTIAPLILLGFLENTFKHSDIEVNDQGFVTIRLFVSENDELNFECVNSKRYLPDKSKETGGIGLKNVRKRLDLIYAQAHQLVIEDTNEFYTVQLNLPV